MNMKKIELNTFTGYGILLLIGVITSTIGIFLVIRLAPKTPQPPTVVTSTPVVVTPQPSEFPDYYTALKLASTTVALNVSGATNTLMTVGTFQKIYFLITAHVNDDSPLSPVYDDVFVNVSPIPQPPIQKKYSGHLSVKDSLETPPGSVSTLLYSANSLKLKDLQTGNITTVNAINIFSTYRNIYFGTQLSSNNPGTIEQFVIYFECAHDSKCSIVPKY